MSYQPIEEMEFFRLFEEVTDWIWSTVEHWDAFARRTIGAQIVTSADSINANLVEGDGRSTDPDAVRFFVIARASARETRLWLSRLPKRRLAAQYDVNEQIENLLSASRLLNLLIRYRRTKTTNMEVREDSPLYGALNMDPFQPQGEMFG